MRHFPDARDRFFPARPDAGNLGMAGQAVGSKPRCQCVAERHMRTPDQEIFGGYGVSTLEPQVPCKSCVARIFLKHPRRCLSINFPVNTPSEQASRENWLRGDPPRLRCVQTVCLRRRPGCLRSAGFVRRTSCASGKIPKLLCDSIAQKSIAAPNRSMTMAACAHCEPAR